MSEVRRTVEQWVRRRTIEHPDEVGRSTEVDGPDARVVDLATRRHTAVTGGIGRQEGEVCAGRATEDGDAVGVDAVLPSPLVDPADGALHVSGGGLPRRRRRQALLDVEYD